MKMDGRRVLVTGGAGFIGSHLVESLVGQGARVRVLDDFSSGCRANLAAVRDDVEVIEGDVRDAAAVRAALRGCDVVSHQAAQLEITRCIEDPLEDLRANTVATLNVLEAAVRAGVARVLYASSACVYGQPAFLPSDESRHPTNPNWAYGVSKLACEKYAAIFSQTSGIPMTGFRYAIVYGPREWYGRVLTIFLKRLAEGRPPVIFGDGRQQRDFTYVSDVVAINQAVLAQEPPGHDVFNVSTGVGTTVSQLARIATEVTGVNVDPIHEDVAPGQRSRIVEEERMRLPSELEAMVLDPAKGRQRLGWTPQVELRTGLAREWEWYLANRDRWTKLHY
ncbi:MAG TPA: SDR family NAD(P)-dependent oxidoreductase [Isosphaeraceae bacterium]|nr:SDR family NAD(P)-dependent oxidoreductase [Isosphaeraceae bacterium]